MTVFGRDYAGHYDALYAEKDYCAECDLVEEAARRFGHGQRGRLLDVGCGTGGHALELAGRGWTVLGVDRSPAMLALAAAKPQRGAVSWIEGDARTFDAGGRFDVALMMFAVIGYLHDTATLREALQNIRRHLAPGGLFLFDCWYGPAVLAQRPGDRTKVIERGGRRITRSARGTLDSLRHLTTVRYRVVETEGDRVLSDTEEVHTMRYFFPEELRLLLDVTGFETLSMSAFPSLDAPLNEGEWNAFVVARNRSVNAATAI